MRQLENYKIYHGKVAGLRTILFVMVFFLLGCNVYKQNFYDDRLNENMYNQYVNDSLNFSITYAGDFDFFLKKFNLKCIAPKVVFKEVRKSLNTRDEILYVGKTSTVFFINTFGIAYRLNNKNIHLFIENHIANLNHLYHFDTPIEYQTVSFREFKLEYNLTEKSDNWKVIEYIMHDGEYAIRIVFLYSLNKNKKYDMHDKLITSEIENTIRSWSISKK